jgi:hypothetical protein
LPSEDFMPDDETPKSRTTGRHRALSAPEPPAAEPLEDGHPESEPPPPPPRRARDRELAREERPPHPPAAVQVVDRLGDAVGVVCVTYLCVVGKVSGTEALITISALLGVLQGLRRFGGRSAGGFLSIAVGLGTGLAAGADQLLSAFNSGGSA